MRAASASAIQSAAVEKCDLQSIESMCSYLAETVLEEELEEERIAGDDDSVASCSDTEGSTAWLSKDLSMQSSDQEDTTPTHFRFFSRTRTHGHVHVSGAWQCYVCSHDVLWRSL